MSKGKILAVDDTQDNLDVLVGYLKPDGYEIITTHSGQTALDILKQEPFDLVLLDYMMPFLNGFQVLSAMKQDKDLMYIPVIMISASSELEKVVNCIQVGAEDYLSKPFELTLLRARISASLEKKHLRDMEKSYQEQLRSKENEMILQQKMASLGELTAGIAHEIKNPLNFINNFSTIVETRSLEAITILDESKDLIRMDVWDKLHEKCSMLASYAKKISEHGARADQIITYMLNLSRSSSEEKQKDDLNRLIEQGLFFAYHGFKGRKADFQINIVKDLEKNLPSFSVIAHEFTRALLNIFDNAFSAVEKKTGDFKPEMHVSTKYDDQYIYITIKDNGCGIPNEDISKLFKPFFTTKEHGKGTGLGLSHAHDCIVKKHNGNIDVRSVVNEGTEFLIKLPR